MALDKHGAPDFAGLQAALSEGKTDELIFFVFDLLFARGRGSARPAVAERKARLQDCSASQGQAPGDPLCRPFRDRRRCGAGVRLPMDLEGIVSKQLDAPYRSGRGETGSRPSAAPATRW